MRALLRCARPLTPLAVALAVAAASRFAWLGNGQLFRDEAASWHVASFDLPDLVSIARHETFPPLYPVLLHGWLAVAGDDEAALRTLSVLVGFATIVVTWRWARGFLSPAGAFVAALVVGVGPAALAIDREARMYALEALAATSAWFLIWRVISAPLSRVQSACQLIALSIAVAGEVWTISLGIPTAGLQVVACAGIWAWLRRSDPPTARRTLRALGSVVVGGSTLLPWLPSLMALADDGQPFWTPRPNVVSIFETMGSWVAGPHFGMLTPVLGLGVAGVIAAGILSLWSAPDAAPFPDRPARERRLAAVVLLASLSLIPVVWAYSQGRSIYDDRYFAELTPMFALSTVAALTTISRIGRQASTRRSRDAALAAKWATVAALTLSMIGGSGDVLATSVTDLGMDPGRQVAQELIRRARPGDVILTLNAQSYFPLRYYLERPGWLSAHGVRLLDWHRPNSAFFTGWQDIPVDRLVDARRIETTGWHRCTGLRDGGTIWLVTVVDPPVELPKFEPLNTGELVSTQRIDVQGNGRSGEIVAAHPIASGNPNAARPEVGARGGPRSLEIRNESARRNLGPASFARSENRSSRSVLRGPFGQELLYRPDGDPCQSLIHHFWRKGRVAARSPTTSAHSRRIA